MMFGSRPPPHSLLVDGCNCRVWYKGQPLICNLCGLQGHKSANCTNKDMCCRCGVLGHFARACPQAWGSTGASFARPGGSTSLLLQLISHPSHLFLLVARALLLLPLVILVLLAVVSSQDSLGDCPDVVSLSPGAFDSTPGNDESCAAPANPDPVIMHHSGISSDCALAVHGPDGFLSESNDVVIDNVRAGSSPGLSNDSNNVSCNVLAKIGPELIDLGDDDNVSGNVGTTIGPSV